MEEEINEENYSRNQEMAPQTILLFQSILTNVCVCVCVCVCLWSPL